MTDTQDRSGITTGEIDRRLSAALEVLGCRIGSLDQAIRDMTERMITRVEYEADRKSLDHRFADVEKDVADVRGEVRGFKGRAWWVVGLLIAGIAAPIVVAWATSGGN